MEKKITNKTIKIKMNKIEIYLSEGRIEEVICKNCLKVFPRSKGKIKKIRGIKIVIRHKNTITCSPKCSKEYNYKRYEEPEEKKKRKEYKKEYDSRKEVKEHKREYQKEWRQKNKDKINKKAREWRDNNKERINKKDRENYHKYKEEKNEI